MSRLLLVGRFSTITGQTAHWRESSADGRFEISAHGSLGRAGGVGRKRDLPGPRANRPHGSLGRPPPPPMRWRRRSGRTGQTRRPAIWMNWRKPPGIALDRKMPMVQFLTRRPGGRSGRGGRNSDGFFLGPARRWYMWFGMARQASGSWGGSVHELHATYVSCPCGNDPIRIRPRRRGGEAGLMRRKACR